MRSVAIVFALVFTPLVNAEIPLMVEQPGGGYIIGAHGYAKILKDSNLYVAAAPMTVYKPNTGVGTPPGQFTAAGTMEVSLLRSRGFGGTSSQSESKLRANWVPTIGLGTFAPHIGLEFGINCKGTAPVVPPPVYCASNLGAVGGVVGRDFRLVNPVPDHVYRINGVIQYAATFVANKAGINGISPARNAELYGSVGDNWVQIKWNHNLLNPDGSRGAWSIVRRVRLQTGLWEAAGPITTFVRTPNLPTGAINAYVDVKNNEPFLNTVNISEVTDPRLNQDWVNKSYMHELICPAGITGTDDDRDDQFDAMIKVIPIISTSP